MVTRVVLLLPDRAFAGRECSEVAGRGKGLRPSKQEPLPELAAEVDESVELVRLFDSLGGDG